MIYVNMITQNDKTVPLNSEDLGLNLIMNMSKLARKQEGGLQKNHVHSRLMKSFQILETRISSDDETSPLINDFASYFENKINDIIHAFHKERIGKID